MGEAICIKCKLVAYRTKQAPSRKRKDACYHLVRLMGLEPIRAFAHHPLKMACLPFHHNRICSCIFMVPQGRIELPTHGFSVRCSTD